MYKGLVVRFADVLSFFFNIYDENEIIWSHFHRIIKKRGGGGGGGSTPSSQPPLEQLLTFVFKHVL